MSLIGALNNAISGLGVTQRNIDVVSRNVSNLQTPGYTRKINQQSQRDPASGGGARSDDAIRIVNTALQRDYFSLDGGVENLKVLETSLKRLEVISGNPQDQKSVVSALGNLQSAFVQLVASPDALPYQQAVVTAAKVLVESLNSLASGYNAERDRTQADIGDAVTRVNGNLARIATLNASISAAQNAGRKVPDLEDQRDESIRLLSQDLSIQRIDRANGTTAILTSNGRTLVDEQANQLRFQPTGTSPTSIYPLQDINPIQLNGFDITTELTGGRLGGLLTLRDQTIPRFQAQLDQLSVGLASGLNKSGLRLFVDSDPKFINKVPTASANIDLANLNQSQQIGFAGRIQVDPLVVATPTLVQQGFDGTKSGGLAPADPTEVRRILDQVFSASRLDIPQALNITRAPSTATASIVLGLSTNVTAGQFASDLIVNQTAARATVSEELQGQTSLRDALLNRLQNQSGVNLDQETALLIQLQQTYAANARVISTTQKLLDEILNAVR